jgi:hypothetical protein
MPQGSFGRKVARAAASGGSRTYRGRAPLGFYTLIVAICVIGVSLIVYSRYERLHPHTKPNPSAGPGASANWHQALAIDICGKVQPNLPANSNLTAVGIRTFGNGLIDVSPGAVTDATSFENKNATLGTFAISYPGLDLSATSIKLPGTKAKTYTNGERCSSGGVGELRAKVWTSPTDAHPTTVKGSAITALRLRNGQMITIAFLPANASVPEPPSKATLVQTLRGS